MGHIKWVITGQLINLVVLSCETTTEIEEQSDTCVWVEVNLHQSHKSSELTCEGPEKPLNGGYVSDADVVAKGYNTGDTVRYYCNRGHQLIGNVNRTCNGTSKQWEPDGPYCQPEYIGDLMRKLNGIEAEMKVIKQSIATLENNTLQIGYNELAMKDKVTVMDNRVAAMDNTMSLMNNKVSSMENNMSDIYIMSKMGLIKLQVDTERILACTGVTSVINEDTVSKCMTMQLGVRNGHSASVYTWVIEDSDSKVPKYDMVVHDSPPFYHTVPGYKWKLRANIYSHMGLYINFFLLPGEHDDQLKWPISNKYDLTVVTNDGTEVTHQSFSGDQSECRLDRPAKETSYCRFYNSAYEDVRNNRKYILKDGSAIIKVYFYN